MEPPLIALRCILRQRSMFQEQGTVSESSQLMGNPYPRAPAPENSDLAFKNFHNKKSATEWGLNRRAQERLVPF
jgi:hypothetical protein